MSNITYPAPSATTCPLYGGASAKKGGGHVIRCGGWESPFSSDKEYQARIEKCKGPEKESCRFFLLDWMRKNGHEDEITGLSDEAIHDVYDGYQMKTPQKVEITPAAPVEGVTPLPVELREAPSPDRTIADITAEIRFYKAQTVQSVIEIGKRLTEAKGMLEHGQWLGWLKMNVEISERTARNFMRLADEFSNRQPVADLPYTKLLALLSVPEKDREEFLEVTHNVGGQEKTVAEMSKRELEQVIRERNHYQELMREHREAAEKYLDQLKGKDKELERALREQMRLQDLAKSNDKLAQVRMEEIYQAQKALSETKAQAQVEKRRLEQEIKRLENRPVEVAVQPPSQKELDRIREEARQEALAEVDMTPRVMNPWLEQLLTDKSDEYFWSTIRDGVYILTALAAKKTGRAARETLEQGIAFLQIQINELRKQCNQMMMYEPPGELEEDFDFSPES